MPRIPKLVMRITALKIWTNANSLQRILLISALVLHVITAFLTWYAVIYKQIFTEGEALTASFISQFGSVGLLLHTIYALVLIFLTWLLWVFSAKHITSKFLAFLPPLLFMCFFTIVIFDFSHDLLMLIFRSNALVAPLNSRDFIFILGLTLSILIAGFQNLKARKSVRKKVKI